MTKLSVLIATTEDRRPLFEKLYDEFEHQRLLLADPNDVEVRYVEDNKEMSIGAKRNLLLHMAVGDYIVFFDSDDFPYWFYLNDILNALRTNPDCVGFLIHMTTNGKNPQVCCHSLRFKVWAKKKGGYDYVRNVTQFNPVRRDLALQVGFRDMRYGEDKIYSDALTELCHREVFINKKLFHYRYSNAVQHKKKYGIK